MSKTWKIANDGSRDCLILRGSHFSGIKTFVAVEDYDLAIFAMKEHLSQFEKRNWKLLCPHIVTTLQELGEL